MLRYVTGRLAQSVFVLFGISIVGFGLPRLTGSPVDVLLPPEASPVEVARVEQLYGLSKPLLDQYWQFVSHTSTGDLGQSLIYHASVMDLVGDRLLVTLELVGLATLVVIPVGIGLGVVSAINHGRAADLVIRGAAFTLQAIPTFWLGIVLIYFVAIKLQWVPISGANGGFSSYILPALVLTHFPVAALLRLTRKEVLEVLDSDFVEFARMKGMSERTVIWKHVLRNSLIGPLTYSGLLVATLLTGTVIVETVFALPGVGALAVSSIKSRDYPVIQALLLIFASMYVIVNLLVDIGYGLVDPRIRRGG